MKSIAAALMILLASLGGVRVARAQSSIRWLSDYHEALDMAQSQRKLVLIWFCDPQVAAANADWEDSTLARPDILRILSERFVAARLPVDAHINSQGQMLRLLEHPSLADLERRAGLAVIDMTDETDPLFRQVVSIYPLVHRTLSAENMAVLLSLPRGTLTQRTLIYAVRTHPEQPSSTAGHLSQLLTRETENHAWHQASIGLQGHHNWDARFHAIGRELPGGLAAREVCAESWPGQSLMDAAEECVHSWRQSPGHWQAVNSRHALYGYDMKRGRNGIWYAAGIFASR